MYVFFVELYVFEFGIKKVEMLEVWIMVGLNLGMIGSEMIYICTCHIYEDMVGVWSHILHIC